MNRNKKNRMIAIVAGFLLATLLLVPGAQTSQAGSATWDLNPGSNEWNTAANWTPMTVPNGPADTATFGLTNTVAVSLSASTEVNGISFTAGASAYSINPHANLTISGTGITNGSGSRQNFVSGGIIKFTNSATAGNAWFENRAGDAGTEFHDSSTADNGTISNEGDVGSPLGGRTQFFDHSTARNATVWNGFGGDEGGITDFFDSSTAGTAIIANLGGTGRFSSSGVTNFRGTSSAGDSTITIGGGADDANDGASTLFLDDHGWDGTHRGFRRKHPNVPGPVEWRPGYQWPQRAWRDYRLDRGRRGCLPRGE
jgi:hypothetical protein